MKHKVLLIGLGSVGMGYDFNTKDSRVISTHARAFANHVDFELAGGVDPNADTSEKFQQRYGGWAGTDIAEALQTVNPDVVVIASPTQYHAEAVQMALRYAKPKLILCEKPLSYSLEDARTMVTSSREAGCLLYVNYLRRVEPGVQEVKHRIQSGAIAAPLKGVLWYTKGLLHNGSHFSNLLEFWLGPVEKFSVINTGRRFGQDDFEPDVQVRFSSGDVTFLAACEEHFSHHEIQLIGPNGRLYYAQGGGEILWQDVTRDHDFPEFTVLSYPGERIVTESERLQWHVTDQVSACLRGQSSSLCSGYDALRTLESILEMKAAL